MKIYENAKTSEEREVGLQKRVQQQTDCRSKCTSTTPQTTDAALQSVKVLTRSRARGDTLTLPNGGHRTHLLHTGTPWTYLAFNRSKKKTHTHTHYPVQVHEFIGTWHWQRPLTTMVTIHTTSFNTEELYTLPLESVCVAFRSLRGRRTIFVHCIWQPQASKGYCRMLASNLVTSEFMYRNNPVWIPSGLPVILSEVLFGLPSNFPCNAGKDKTNTQNNYKIITNPWHRTLKSLCVTGSCATLRNHLKHNGNNTFF